MKKITSTNVLHCAQNETLWKSKSMPGINNTIYCLETKYLIGLSLKQQFVQSTTRSGNGTSPREYENIPE